MTTGMINKLRRVAFQQLLMILFYRIFRAEWRFYIPIENKQTSSPLPTQQKASSVSFPLHYQGVSEIFWNKIEKYCILSTRTYGWLFFLLILRTRSETASLAQSFVAYLLCGWWWWLSSGNLSSQVSSPWIVYAIIWTLHIHFFF